MLRYFSKNIIFGLVIVLMMGIYVACEREVIVPGGQSSQGLDEAWIGRTGQGPSLKGDGERLTFLLARLGRDSAVVSMVKGYFESKLGDSLFLYRVRLDTLRRWYNGIHGGGSFEQLLQSKLGGRDFGFVMSRLNGVEEGGKRYYPVLNVFYYHKDFKELSGWDGGFVTEALFNWDADGKVVGYTRTGDQVVYAGDSTKLLSEFLSRARWIVEWEDEGEVQYRPWLAICQCYTRDGSDHCGPKPEGGSYNRRFCGVGKAGPPTGGCLGFCLRNFLVYQY